MKGLNGMQNKTFIKKLTPFVFFFLAIGCAGADAQPEQPVIKTEEAAQHIQLDSKDKKPLVAYYSRTGNARMLANSLAAQLGADIEEMQSEEDRGIFTIIGEQWFWGDDEQKPLEKNLHDYSPIIVVAPIYLMQLSAPGRFFIEELIPDGSDVYVFTTSGGPLAGFTQEGIEELVVENGLNAKGVYGFQAGKTQEEFDKEVSEFLAGHQIISVAPEEPAQPKEETAADAEEEK
jgi:flavodoxin